MKKNQKKGSACTGELKKLSGLMKKASTETKPDISAEEKNRRALQKKRSKRNLTYISWLDNERRLRNLTTP